MSGTVHLPNTDGPEKVDEEEQTVEARFHQWIQRVISRGLLKPDERILIWVAPHAPESIVS